VFGEPFSKKEFNKKFEFVLDRAKRHFELLGLTEDGKPVSKNKFKNLADVHTYKGHGSKLIVHYFHGFFNGDKVLYGFYPIFNKDTKVNCLNNAYRMFIDFLNGESDDFDCGDIQFGNMGIRLSYGSLGQRYVDTSVESIF